MLATFLGIPINSVDWFTELRMLFNPFWWLQHLMTSLWDATLCALFPFFSNCQ